ncbi:MAG: ferredoxin family protein [Candidatus Thorarchaeota archaeon]|nr:MAG: ferredoxin family protein [Candidatus Thorarchaeota archaeon]
MITYDYDACVGCEDCILVCPRGVWRIDKEAKKAELANPGNCIDCTACEFQCPVRVIRIDRTLLPRPPDIIRSD